MDTRVALISIIVENNEVIDDINRFLHEAGKYIIGRMGIPYREKGINIISIAIDAPQDVISSLSGKIGRLRGVSAKTAYSNVITKRRTGNDKSCGIRKGRHRKIHHSFQCGSRPCGKRNESDADRL